MTHDPIIEELHQIREQLAKEFNYDIYAIVADARARQAQEDHPVVSFAQPQPTAATRETSESESDRHAA